MKNKIVAITACSVLLLVTGCAQVDKNYAYVVDQDDVNQMENSQRQLRHLGHVVWVNPPMKKVDTNKTPEN